jgi:membrane-associated phospholipid phosphatase
MEFMDAEIHHLRRVDRLIWTLIAIIAGINLAASVLGTFRIIWTTFLAATITNLLLYMAGRFYATTRKNPQAASALTCTAQVIAFAAVGAPLSYIAASASYPLWDGTIAAWDNQFGFDWMAWLATMNNYPTLHWIFALAYSSFTLQTAAVVLTMALTGHVLRLRVYVLSFILVTVVTIAVSAVLPAQGAWGYLHLSPENYPAINPVTQELHLVVFRGLRDGSFRDLVAQGAQGIITFPSLHAAVALLLIVAMWPIKYLRWVGALLNLTMMAATPIDGGHYFADVIAGSTIAMLGWMVAARMCEIPAREVHPFAETPSLVPEIVADIAGELRSPDIESLRRETRTSVN